MKKIEKNKPSGVSGAYASNRNSDTLGGTIAGDGSGSMFPKRVGVEQNVERRPKTKRLQQGGREC